jgi:hypothetical protein
MITARKILEGLDILQEHAQHKQKDHGRWAQGMSVDKVGRRKMRRRRRRLAKKGWWARTGAEEKELTHLERRLGTKRKKKGPGISPTGRQRTNKELELLRDPMVPSGNRAQTGVNGNAYIAKLKSGEQAYVKNIQRSIGHRGKDGAEHEALAEVTGYEVAQELGLDIVPAMVLRNDLKGQQVGPGMRFRDIDTHAIVASEWVGHSTMLEQWNMKFDDMSGNAQMTEDYIQIANDFENMMVIDIITGNLDRHDRQILVHHGTGEYRLAALDFGLSLFDGNIDSWGDQISGRKFVNNYLKRQINVNGDRLFENGFDGLNTSDTGPWQQALKQRSAITKTIKLSMSQGNLPAATVSNVLTAVDERFDALEEMLNDGSLENNFGGGF